MASHALHSRAEGDQTLHEGKEHHEKKSVLKKVKVKAKKLKETITGHHHGHEYEGHHTPDDHDLDEEDDEDVDDPEVHGAPIYDSAIRRTDAPTQGDILKVPVVKFGDTRAGREEYDPIVPRERSNVSDPMRFNLPGLHGTTTHGAMYDSTATRTDAPVQGGTHFGDTNHGYDPTVPRETSNVGDPMRSNRHGLHGTTGHGAMYDSAATRRTDAPMEGGTHFGDRHHEYDPVVPREKSSIGFSGAESDFEGTKSRTTGGHENLLGGTKTKLAGPTTGPGLKHEEPTGPHAPHNTPVSPLPHHGNYNTMAMDVDPSRTSGLGQGGHVDQSRVNFGKTDVLGEVTPKPQSTFVSSGPHGAHRSTMDVDPRQTFVSGQGGHADQSRVNLARPRELEEDPHAPKANSRAYTPSNYETKVTDPNKSAGGEEIGVTPIFKSFDKMNLHGDDRQYLNNGAKNNVTTGSHDQFSPERTNQGSSYTEKISSATSAIAGRAISAKNAVASKLGYGGGEPEDDYSRGYVTGAGKSGSSPRQHQNQVLDHSTNQFRPVETPQVSGTIKPDDETTTDQTPVQTGGSYSGRISTAGSAIADKAIFAKNVVASKLGYGANDQVQDSGDFNRINVQSGSTAEDQQGKVTTTSIADKAVSAKNVVASKLGYGASDQVHDSGNVNRTKVQSGSTVEDQHGKGIITAIADGAISAKNIVASKLGYGAGDQVHDSRVVSSTNVQSGSTAADQHGKGITTTVAEKLSPVYEKVTGAGSAVMSKIGGSVVGADRDASPRAVDQSVQDKGVSVKDYFAEKLRPGEEDRALSEVISETLYKHKPGMKEETRHSASYRPKGKVTESVEVRQRLGETRNDNFVVERIKESVGSMLRGTDKSDEERQRGLSGSPATGEI